MTPTAEQIEKVLHMTCTSWTRDQLQGLRRFIHAWEQVAPRVKPFPMHKFPDLAPESRDTILSLAKRGHLTIEDEKGGE